MVQPRVCYGDAESIVVQAGVCYGDAESTVIQAGICYGLFSLAGFRIIPVSLNF